MVFLTLIKKELREALPWLVLAMLGMLVIGGFLLRSKIEDDQLRPQEYWDGQLQENWNGHDLMIRPSEMDDFGPLVLTMAGALAVTMAVTQFLLPGLLKTWPFTIHRAASKGTILLSKVAGTALGLGLAIGCVWTGLFLWACQPGLLHYPPEPKMLAEGWTMIAAAFMVYVGGATSALSTAHWYTTRIFALAFSVLLAIAALLLTGIAASLALICIGLFILSAQLLHRFLNGEF